MRLRRNRVQKETDIFDVWFESGASHHSVLRKNPSLGFPADLYLEGTDQHRGWFQSSLLESVLAGNQAPFRTAVTNGFLVDARTGDKLSKSGYLIPTEEIWEHARFRSQEPSVHLACWPEPPGIWHSESLAAKYERLLAVRRAVNRALERLRETGSIGRSLDARVTIHAADPALADLLAEADRESLFLVSEASLAALPVGDADAERPDVRVRAEPSPYPRCERCRARRSSVGADREYTHLCDRCVATLRPRAESRDNRQPRR